MRCHIICWLDDIEIVLAVHDCSGFCEDFLAGAKDVNFNACETTGARLGAVNFDLRKSIGDTRRELSMLGVEKRLALIMKRGVLLAHAGDGWEYQKMLVNLIAHR